MITPGVVKSMRSSISVFVTEGVCAHTRGIRKELHQALRPASATAITSSGVIVWAPGPPKSLAKVQYPHRSRHSL
jgi:hypothetical protein